ncbi:MAG: GFA family protein [Myxococcota bacterium]
MSHTGRCFCGAVEIEASGEPAVMGLCHCESCRTWLAAPVHGFTLWPQAQVKVVKGEAQLGVTKKTEASHRRFCRECGGAMLVDHPSLGLVDVMSVRLPSFDFRPTVHVHYGEKVLSIPDGLPKYKDLPKDFGGSGETLPE